jgi:hypothetical protein
MLVSGGGCTVAKTDMGWCFAPLFRVELNHPRRRHQQECHECNAAPGAELQEGSVIEGAVITQGGGMLPAGGTMVEGGLVGTVSAPLSSANLGTGSTGGAADMGAGRNTAGDAGASAGGTQQRAAKPAPGALQVSVGLPAGKPLVSAGSVAVFGVRLENSGGEPIEWIDLIGTFVGPIVPQKVTRIDHKVDPNAAVPSTSVIRTAEIAFERIERLAPGQTIDFQVTAKIEGKSGAMGTFEVSVRSSAYPSGQPVIKAQPVTIQ